MTRQSSRPTSNTQLRAFLPMSRQEMDARDWEELDILLVSGDAYVDHPAFGTALIGRCLESKGYRVGIIAQPAWRDPQSVATLGCPRLFAGVTAGAMDSMLNLYTANKKRRSEDAYSPAGRNDLRPARATIVYCNLLRQAFPGLPLIIGGIEASLRRFAHYDYWDDRIRSSILLDSGADLLVYGMGEMPVLEVARRLSRSGRKTDLRFIPGTVFAGSESDLPGKEKTIALPSRQEIQSNPEKLVDAAKLTVAHSNPYSKDYIAQEDGNRLVISVHPQRPLKTKQLDAIYDLPFTRRAHFSYKLPIPALETVRFSITVHRGCYGGCTFCALGLHQGKAIQSRSIQSITREIERLSTLKGFRGIITDLGGPTANMYGTGCTEPEQMAKCKRASCLFPKPCRLLKSSHESSLCMLKAVRNLDCLKKAFIASGIRYDLALLDPQYIDELASHHVGGHLSVAPEHCVDRVLSLMGKPAIGVFERFMVDFKKASQRANKEQYLIPYLLSGFPGCTNRDMTQVQRYLSEHRMVSQQVQAFIPTPMTRATAMFYSGRSLAGDRIYVARTAEARKRQHRHLTTERRSFIRKPRSSHRKRR